MDIEGTPVRRILAGLIMLTAVPFSVIVGAVPASASSRAVVYACDMGTRWGCPSVRPREIGFGAHYDVARMHWSSWSRRSAYGRGHYYGFGSYQAHVKLYDVRTHHGRRYFSWIKITASGHRTRYLNYNGHWHTR